MSIAPLDPEPNVESGEGAKLDISIAGLGRMGANMARRLHRAGHHVVAYNRTADKTR